MILLTGFMGCGKSTLGPLLALCLDQAFLDLDREVERLAGRDAAGIFAAEGEEGFRAREREAFRRLAAFGGVLALGGGLPCQPGLADEIRAAGNGLYLDAPVEVLLERLLAPGAAPRPLLDQVPAEGRAAFLRDLHARRDPFYRRAARAVPLPAGESVPQHLDRLLAALRPDGASR
jgi:shikimate kinase